MNIAALPIFTPPAQERSAPSLSSNNQSPISNPQSPYSAILDLETLSTRPNAVITEIGVLIFNRNDFSIVDELLIIPGFWLQILVDRHLCPNTIRFHLRNGTLPTSGGENDPEESARSLADFLKCFNPHRVWIQGPDFDRPIIEDFCRQYGVAFPWDFWRTRDTRTVWDLAFPGRKHAPRPHTALADCHATLQDLRDALNRIGLGPDNVTAATLHPSPPTP